MKKTKRILSVLLAVVMILSMLPLSISSAVVIANGTTGNCQWSLDDSGVFTVSGNGTMGFYSEWQYSPYLNRYRDKIITAKIEEGVTEVGSNAFCCCEKLNSVEICDSATAIQFYAFNNCFSLSTVKLPENLTYIGTSAFYQCYALETVHMGRNIKTIESYAFGRCNSLKEIYYSGTEEEWNSINIRSGNDYLKNANIHFNSGATKEETVFIKEHTDFVTTNKQYANLFVSNSFYENIWLYEEDSEGKKIVSGSIWEYLGDFDELVSFKIDGLTIAANPYDLVFFDLINSYNTVESYKEIGLTKYYKKFNEIYDGIMKLFKSTSEWQNDMSDSIKNALIVDIEKFLSTDNYQFSSSDAYEYFCDFLTDSKDNKKIENIFTGLNLASDVSSYISTAGDIAEVFRDICNAYATAVAFKETDQVFKDILNYCDAMLAIDHDRFSGQFSAVLNDYFSIRTDNDAFSYALNRNLASVVTLAFDTIAKDFLQNSAVTAFSTKLNIDKVKASKALLTYSWTYNILEYVTKTGEKSEVYKLMAAAAHLEKYLHSYNDVITKDLLAKQSIDAAVKFDSSWRMLQSINGFAYESFAKYIDLEKKATNWEIAFDSVADFIGNKIRARVYGSDGGPLIAVPIKEHIENEIYYKSLETSYVATSLKWRETSCHTKNYDMRKLLSVMCPTEVYIYKDNNLVLSITDTEIVCNDNNVSYSVIGSEKYISLPCNEEYNIKITATDNGEMTYNIQEIYEDKTVRFISYDNVPLENGKSYMGNIPTEIYIPSELYNLVSEDGSIKTADVNIYDENDLLIENGEKKEPTDSEDGYIKTTVGENEYIIILHNWTDETISEATCTVDGKTSSKCKVCDEVKLYNIIDATGHKYETDVVVPTCNNKGYTSYVCNVCGDTYEDSYVDEIPHIDTNKDNLCDNCGEKIKQDVDTNCNHICHTDNKFLKFIWTIFNFFMKLFSMERICTCGAAHY